MTKIIKISALAALVTSSLVGADIDAKLSEMEAKINALQTQLNQSNKTLTEVKAHDGNDNLKFGVDFRTAIDSIHYKTYGGGEASNPDLLTNRLWLTMGYEATPNTLFKGKLSYMKAYGDSVSHQQSNIVGGSTNLQAFDWVVNENTGDNSLKVKEAYWLYNQEKLFGTDVPWGASVGRRPSTDGLPTNIKNDQSPNSPLSHVVDVEFDGFSIKFDTQSLTGLTGSWFKICGGRGLTNATPRFDMFTPAYAEDDSKNVNIDMLGFIAVPYDDGQYSVHMNYAKAWNLIGFDQNSLNTFGGAYNTYSSTPNSNNAYALQMAIPQFKDVGDIQFATVLFKTEGIGNGISNYLDKTVAFASFAGSKTDPNEKGMLGSLESETGTSVWLGVNAPCPILPDSAKIGFEWNKGSKYWRSMTYGEDTYAGSKIATRGQAWEVYRTQKLTNSLSFGLSYVLMKYDYTGSNSFFGTDGTPMTMAEAVSYNQNPVEEARDIKAYIRYKF
jgi:hypothetical protein